jgi:hypothetical protein
LYRCKSFYGLRWHRRISSTRKIDIEMPTMNTTANKSEDKLVQISAGQATLEGNLIIPKSSRGIVLFAHGSGSGRHSPRNKYVAEVLQDAGIATLLIDLFG